MTATAQRMTLQDVVNAVSFMLQNIELTPDDLRWAARRMEEAPAAVSCEGVYTLAGAMRYIADWKEMQDR